MSAVRMCDKCGAVFSELSDGWETYSATTRKKGEDGRTIATQLNLDACTECSLGGGSGYEAPPALQNTAGSDPKYFERLALEKENEELKTKISEHQAKISEHPEA